MRNEQKNIRLSVTELVEVLRRRDDLHGSSSDLMAAGRVSAREGIETHRRVQKKYRAADDEILTEVSFCKPFLHRNHCFEISGRIDLLVQKHSDLHVVEVKTTSSPSMMKHVLAENPEHPHIVQAALYAWMLASDQGQVRASLLYESAQSSASAWYPVSHEENWTERKLCSLLDIFLQERSLARVRRRQCKALGRQLVFPYPRMRTSQGKLINAVAEHFVARQGALMLEAPTGSGKTISSLFPAIQVGCLKGRQVAFGTSKNAQKIAAAQTLRDLTRTQRLEGLSGVVIGSKEALCANPQEPVCQATICPYAKDYYAKVRQNRLMELSKRGLVFDEPVLKRLGTEYQVCPFELALDLSLHTQVFVCDYNHFIAPRAQLERHFALPERRRKVQMLIDEAHCFPERVRSQFSPELSEVFLSGLSRLQMRYFEKRALAIQILTSGLESDLRGRMGVMREDGRIHLPKEALLTSRYADFCQSLQLAYLRYTSRVENPAHNDLVLQHHQDFLAFDELLQKHDCGEGAAYSVIIQPPGDFARAAGIRLLCKDASLHLGPFFAESVTPLLMSATLSPAEDFRHSFGLPEDTKFLRVDSPFAPENRKLFIVPQITTLYRHRQVMIPKIASVLERVLPCLGVNTFVFFPSFDFIHRVADCMDIQGLQDQGWEIIQQAPRSTFQETEEVLVKFRSSTQKKALFACHGGSFSEGVDLPGQALEAVIVVGPALPPVSMEQKLMQKYFDAKGEAGFDRVSVIPAMARVNQAIGRLIRSESDRGLCLLLDARFLENRYFGRLAEEWKGNGSASHISRGLSADITSFFKTSTNPGD